MASIPHWHHSDYPFSDSSAAAFSKFFPTPQLHGSATWGGGSGGGTAAAAAPEDHHYSSMFWDVNNIGGGAVDVFQVQQESNTMVNNNVGSSILAAAAAAAVHVVPTAAALPSHHHNNMLLCDVDDEIQSFVGTNRSSSSYHLGPLPETCDFREDQCSATAGSGFLHDFKPAAAALRFPPLPSANTWGIEHNNIHGIPAAIEETNLKVGRYSVEERKDRILRYLKKRNQRNFNKTIKYACRKTLADRRVRVRGRFARNSELSEEEVIVMKKEEDSPISNEKDQLFCGDSFQMMKHDIEDDWLQEAMANLMYLPYISG